MILHLSHLQLLLLIEIILELRPAAPIAINYANLILATSHSL